MNHMKLSLLLGAAVLVIFINGCTPTVRVEAPSEPIQINMNVKIQQEVRVRVERDLEKEFASNPELFGIPMPSNQGTN